MRIAILGANGQVGAELAILLHGRPDVDLRCVVRSDYSTTLFRLLGIPTVTCRLDDAESLSTALADRDLVVDMTYPKGEFIEFAEMMSQIVTSALAAMPSGSTFVYMSSIMAYGNPGASGKLRNYRIARTSYAVLKRRTERLVEQLGRRLGIRVHVVRMGQVHGYLQQVTAVFLAAFRKGTVQMLGSPDELTNTIFVSSFVEAVLGWGRDSVSPGQKLTLVSSPQWTLGQLVDVYLNLTDSKVQVEFQKPIPDHPILGPLMSTQELREILEAHVLIRIPWLVAPLKGLYRRSAVVRDLNRSEKNRPPAPIPALLGPVNGWPMPEVESSPSSALAAYREVEQKVQAVLPNLDAVEPG